MPGIKPTMEEFAAGNLHSGSKMGPRVTNPKQAAAIGFSEARKAGQPAAPAPPPGSGPMSGNIPSIHRLMQARGHRFGAVGYD